MHRTPLYFGLFLAAVLLQVFLFNNLTISIYLNPLVYIVFIALLPLDTQPVTILGAGLALGVTMDFAMGTAGICTISSLLIAFLRPTLTAMICGRDNAREGGIPSSSRLGAQKFVVYLLVLSLLHNTIFFFLEALSWVHVFHTLLRIGVSTGASVLFIWVIARIFTAKIPARI